MQNKKIKKVRRAEYIKNGVMIFDNNKIDFSDDNSKEYFGFINFEQLNDDNVFIYSLQGIEDENFENQNVYYTITSDKGETDLVRVFRYDRDDYAQLRGDSKYKKCGA